MKIREDIKEFFVKTCGESYNTYYLNFYEQDGLLYVAHFDNEKDKNIITYGNYNHFTGEVVYEPYKSLRFTIEEKFNVKFAERGSDLICKCGESKSFSAFYGSYEISLRCNSCKNLFVAYDG